MSVLVMIRTMPCQLLWTTIRHRGGGLICTAAYITPYHDQDTLASPPFFSARILTTHHCTKLRMHATFDFSIRILYVPPRPLFESASTTRVEAASPHPPLSTRERSWPPKCLDAPSRALSSSTLRLEAVTAQPPSFVLDY